RPGAGSHHGRPRHRCRGPHRRSAHRHVRTAGPYRRQRLEVRESLEVLAGGGPADVVELTCALAREMLAASGVDDPDVEAALADGRAMDTWRAMITAQGGDVDAPLPEARHVEQVRAESDGVVTGLD